MAVTDIHLIGVEDIGASPLDGDGAILIMVMDTLIMDGVIRIMVLAMVMVILIIVILITGMVMETGMLIIEVEEILIIMQTDLIPEEIAAIDIHKAEQLLQEIVLVTPAEGGLIPEVKLAAEQATIAIM